MYVRRALVVAVCVHFLTACGRLEYPYASLSEDGGSEPVESQRPAPPPFPLRIAIAAVMSPVATLDAYEPLLAYLADRLGRPIQPAQRGTYGEVNELIRSRAVDFGIVCPGAYVEGHREFGMELLVAPEVQGRTTYYSYVIVRRDSVAQSLRNLRGQRFAFSDPLSNSGHLAVQWQLYVWGETPESFFSSTIFTGSHDNSIHAVTSGLVDGAAVDSLVYDFVMAQTPGYSFQSRIIGRLGPFGISPVVVHPALATDLKGRLRRAFLSMDQDEAGRAVLARLMIDRFVVLQDSAYDSIRTMAGVIRGWSRIP